MDNEEIKILLQMFNVAVFILKINDLKPAIDASKPSSTIYGILTSSDICVKLNSGIITNNNYDFSSNLYVCNSALRHGLGFLSTYITNRYPAYKFFKKEQKSSRFDQIVDPRGLFVDIRDAEYGIFFDTMHQLASNKTNFELTLLVKEIVQDMIIFKKYADKCTHFKYVHGLSFFNPPLSSTINTPPAIPPPVVLPPPTISSHSSSDLGSSQPYAAYSYWWSVIPNEVKVVIETIREEMKKAFPYYRNKPNINDSNMEEEDVDHSKVLRDSYKEALEHCPTLMTIIYGIIISQHHLALFDTESNDVILKLDKMHQQLVDPRYRDQDFNAYLTLTQYAGLCNSLLEQGLAANSKSKGISMAKGILAALEKYKIHSSIIHDIIMNNRFKGRIKLTWLDEISQMFTRGGLTHTVFNDFCKLRIAKSVTAEHQVHIKKLDQFVKESFEKLNEEVNAVIEIPRCKIEVPANVIIANVDNYGVNNYSNESVETEKFTTTVDSLTMMYKAMPVHKSTINYLKDCDANNITPTPACVKFGIDKLLGVYDLVRNPNQRPNWDFINGLVDKTPAHLRDFNMLPSLPVQSGNHAQMIQVFDIMGRNLFKTDNSKNNRFYCTPNDPQFVIEVAKFAVTNYDVVKNCFTTPPIFHLSKHLLEVMVYNPVFMLLLYGPMCKCIDFKPSIYGTVNIQQMNLQKLTNVIVKNKKSNEGLSIKVSLRAIEEAEERFIERELGKLNENAEGEDEEDIYLQPALNPNEIVPDVFSVTSGFDEDENDDSDDENIENIHAETVLSIDRLDINFEEAVFFHLDEFDEALTTDVEGKQRGTKVSRSKNNADANDANDDEVGQNDVTMTETEKQSSPLVKVVAEIIDRRSKTRVYTEKYGRLSKKDKADEEVVARVKLPSNITNLNVKESAIINSAITNHKRLLYYTYLLYFVVEFAEDPNNQDVMFESLNFENLSQRPTSFLELYYSNPLTQMIKESLLKQLDDAIAPFISVIRDGCIKPLLVLMPEFIKYFSMGGRFNIVNSCIFLYAELLHLENKEFGRQDIVKFMAENCTYLNEVLIEMRHSTMAHKLPKFSRKTFQMVRNISMLVSLMSKDRRELHAAFNSILEDFDSMSAIDDEDEPTNQDLFDLQYKSSSESRRQILQFDKLGKEYFFVQQLAKKWFGPLILRYAEMKTNDSDRALLFNYNHLERSFSTFNEDHPENKMLRYYFDRYQIYITSITPKSDTKDSEKEKLDKMANNPFASKYPITIRDLIGDDLIKFLLDVNGDILKKFTQGLKEMGVFDSILDECISLYQSTLSSMKKEYTILTIRNCMKVALPDAEDDDIIDYIKRISSGSFTERYQIHKWPTQVNVEPGTKVKKTSTKFLEQYLGAGGMPSDEEVRKILSTLEWSSDITFPLNNEMEWKPNTIRTRKSISKAKLEKRKAKEYNKIDTR